MFSNYVKESKIDDRSFYLSILMKGAIYHAYGGEIIIDQLKDPSPSPGGVVIKVEATGICRSDWYGWMGNDSDIVLPHVPGHQ